MVRCADVADGSGVCDDGLVIDLSPINMFARPEEAHCACRRWSAVGAAFTQ